IKGAAFRRARKAESEIIRRWPLRAAPRRHIEDGRGRTPIDVDGHAMGSRTGTVILDSDPELVEHGGIQRKQVNGTAFAGIDVCAADVSIQIVHVQSGGAKVEGSVGRGVFYGLVQTERNDHSI